jgi:hypothetical protein
MPPIQPLSGPFYYYPPIYACFFQVVRPVLKYELKCYISARRPSSAGMSETIGRAGQAKPLYTTGPEVCPLSLLQF